MAEVADYQWLTDGPFELPNPSDGVDKDLSFSLPSDLSVSTRGVLTYMVKGPNANYTTKINGAPADPMKALTDFRAVQEVVEGLQPTNNNKVQFKYTGAGKITVTDVVIWFQRQGI